MTPKKNMLTVKEKMEVVNIFGIRNNTVIYQLYINVSMIRFNQEWLYFNFFSTYQKKYIFLGPYIFLK